MKRCQKIAYRAMADILAPLGVNLFIRPGGKHHLVHCIAPDGQTYAQPIAGSPRADDKTMENRGRQNAYRIARKFGLAAQEPEATHHPAKPHHIRNIAEADLNLTRETPLRRDPSRDPWTALATLSANAPQ